jgi:hypothetical protein
MFFTVLLLFMHLAYYEEIRGRYMTKLEKYEAKYNN